MSEITLKLAQQTITIYDLNSNNRLDTDDAVLNTNPITDSNSRQYTGISARDFLTHLGFSSSALGRLDQINLFSQKLNAARDLYENPTANADQIINETNAALSLANSAHLFLAGSIPIRQELLTMRTETRNDAIATRRPEIIDTAHNLINTIANSTLENNSEYLDATTTDIQSLIRDANTYSLRAHPTVRNAIYFQNLVERSINFATQGNPQFVPCARELAGFLSRNHLSFSLLASLAEHYNNSIGSSH